MKIITIIGKDKAMKIFGEVKRIEKEGGMLIMVINEFLCFIYRLTLDLSV